MANVLWLSLIHAATGCGRRSGSITGLFLTASLLSACAAGPEVDVHVGDVLRRVPADTAIVAMAAAPLSSFAAALLGALGPDGQEMCSYAWSRIGDPDDLERLVLHLSAELAPRFAFVATSPAQSGRTEWALVLWPSRRGESPVARRIETALVTHLRSFAVERVTRRHIANGVVSELQGGAKWPYRISFLIADDCLAVGSSAQLLAAIACPTEGDASGFCASLPLVRLSDPGPDRAVVWFREALLQRLLDGPSSGESTQPGSPEADATRMLVAAAEPGLARWQTTAAELCTWITRWLGW